MVEYVVGATVITAGLVYVLVRLSLKTYVTSTIEESIKNEFALERQVLQQIFEREWREREHQDKFRLASLDERMKSHQLAYSLARRMQFSIHDPMERKVPILEDCHSFLDSKILYLTEDVREALWNAVDKYGSYHIYHEAWKGGRDDAEARADLLAAFEAITNLPATIVKATDREATGDLPYLSEKGASPYQKGDRGEAAQ